MKKLALLLVAFIISVQISAQYKPWTDTKQPLKRNKSVKKTNQKAKIQKIRLLNH